MPVLSILFIRASLIYFLAGTTIGSLMLAERGATFLPAIWAFRSVHIEIAILGWVVQLVMGTAYWILPRLPAGLPRGNPFPAWFSFFLLNAGILLDITNTLLVGNQTLHIFSRVLQITGIACFALVIWPRILTFRKDG